MNFTCRYILNLVTLYIFKLVFFIQIIYNYIDLVSHIAHVGWLVDTYLVNNVYMSLPIIIFNHVL